MPFNLKYQYTSLQAIPKLRRASKRLVSQRATVGAIMSSVSYSIAVNDSARENYLAEQSRIQDADIATKHHP
jgi:flagellin-like hook-associated protein FlgL